MTPLWKQAYIAIGLATVAVLPAKAALISFDEIAPVLLTPGESVVSNGFSFTAFDGPGIVDTAAAFGPGTGFDLAAPTGNPGPFYVGLNDSYVRMQAVDDHIFRLVGLDFGFVSALINLFNPGEVPGFLIAAYEDASGGLGGEIFSLGAADANGKFSFQTVGPSGVGALGKGVRSVDFYACTADATGNCVSLNSNFSQFALDNLQVPEPGSLALVLAALALTAGFSRRRA